MLQLHRDNLRQLQIYLQENKPEDFDMSAYRETKESEAQ